MPETEAFGTAAVTAPHRQQDGTYTHSIIDRREKVLLWIVHTHHGITGTHSSLVYIEYIARSHVFSTRNVLARLEMLR